MLVEECLIHDEIGCFASNEGLGKTLYLVKQNIT